jgi:predicted adenylyl cyclase CyaB
MLECELKFRRRPGDGIEERLARLGAVLSGPVHEENAVLDDSRGSLAASRTLLRVRGDGVTTLTVKTPVEAQGMKVRRELETVVDCSPGQLLELLGSIGFTVARRYSKTRRTARLGLVTACLDSLDTGEFLELEAPDPASLLSAVEALGLDPAEGISLSYLELGSDPAP